MPAPCPPPRCPFPSPLQNPTRDPWPLSLVVNLTLPLNRLDPPQERKNARAFNAGVRIDYVLVTPSLLQRVVSCEVLLDLPPKVGVRALKPLCHK